MHNLINNSTFYPWLLNPLVTNTSKNFNKNISLCVINKHTRTGINALTTNAQKIKENNDSRGRIHLSQNQWQYFHH